MPTLDEIRSASRRSAGSSSSSPSSWTCTRARARSSSRPHTSTTSRRRRRLRRLRGGRDRPGADRPRHRGDPRPRRASRRCPGSRTSPASRATSRSRARSGRTARARSSAVSSRRARAQGYEFKMGLELEYFLVQRARGRVDRDRRPARHAREALLRHRGPDAPVRLPDDRLEVLQRARLGELRERPRGRERPVRAELHLRRRADDAATGRSSSATWCTRSPSSAGMIATFMPKPFTHLTGNGCHFHMSLWQDGENVFLDESDPARPRPVGDRLPVHRRAQARTHAPTARSRRRPSTPTSGSRSGTTASGADLVAGLDLVRLQQPHADAPHPRPGPRSRTGRSTAPATPTWRPRPCSRPVSTGSRTELDAGRAERGEPLRHPVRRAEGRAASRRCPRTSSTRRTSSSATTFSARRSAAAATRTTSTTSSASSGTNGPATTSRSRPGRSAST